jgi:hypothetical protein
MRSKIPKVVGILMIIFASLGLLFGLIGLAGNSANSKAFEHIDAFKTFNTVALAFGVIGLGISALHLYGGIRAVGYRSNAPGLAKMYGVINIGTTVTYGAIVFAWLKPAIETAVKETNGDASSVSLIIGAGVMFGVIIGCAWPIIVLALMTRPAAKAACTN